MDELMTVTIDNYQGKTIKFTMPAETYLEYVTQYGVDDNYDIDYDQISFFEIRAVGKDIKKEIEDKYQISFKWEQ